MRVIEIKSTFVQNLLFFMLSTLFFILVYSTNGSAAEIEKWDFAINQKKHCSLSDQVGNNGCIANEYKSSDSELNYVYKSLINNLVDLAPLRESKLRESQRAWIQFRDKTCAYELSGVDSEGSEFSYDRHVCLINLTEKRILDIKKYIEDINMGL